MPACFVPYFEKDALFMFSKSNSYPYSIGCSKRGVYGKNCDTPCPNNCRYKTCHINKGTCFGCLAGYQGTICKTGMFCFS